VGRLFWKFFLFIWLAQLVGMLGVGTVFWFEHHRGEERRANAVAVGRAHWLAGAPHEIGAAFGPAHPPGTSPDFEHPAPPRDRAPPDTGFHLPMVPFVAALLASLACAIGLAWYFAKPIRHLRNAFDAAADGNLDVRIGSGMGGRRDELADLGRDFDRMSERLCVLLGAQKRLLHDVSHEMRSPLARLQAAIGLARQQPERMENSLARIERESERMNVLVGELLTLSRLDVGVVGAQENVDLSELLNNIVEDARFEGAARQLRVDLVVDELREVHANAELLHRAIENIVRNALRYSPEGGTVLVEARRTVQGIRLAVSDRGLGVQEDELEKIFQAFYRNEKQAAGNGYGLGLAIAKRVFEAINGEIKAENQAGGGLVVEIVLNIK
jgi:signal transduction histidine kinase